MIYARRLLERIVVFANDDSIEDPQETALAQQLQQQADMVAARMGYPASSGQASTEDKA